MRATCWAIVWAACLATSVAACTATVRDGVFACSDDTQCPAGFRCGGGRCRNHAGAQCRQDAQCDDGVPCTEDVCESGYCNHAPDASVDGTWCDDGTFCNGVDECRAGVCTNVGPAPCPVCDEASQGCTECGRIGLACCAGESCYDGGRCAGGTCTLCGGATQPCCMSFPDCDAGLACDPNSRACTTCGGDGEPCCNALLTELSTPCQPGHVCDYMGGAVCRACGTAGHPCCDEGCTDGSFCQRQVLLGDTGQCIAVSCVEPCGPGSICGPDPAGVSAGECIPCGMDLGPCCADLSCTMGGACYGGYCGGGPVGF